MDKTLPKNKNMRTISDLAANPRNPRTATDEKLTMLKRSYQEHGDLNGIVFNRRSGQLIGGHQTQKSIPSDSEIVIEKEYDKPTKTGTVAEGHINLYGERLKYREVDVDEAREKAMNIAANKGAGEWNLSGLTDWLHELDALNFDLDLTMFSGEELANLMAPVEQLEEIEEEDIVPSAPEDPKTALGDLYEFGRHRLLCGDSTDLNLCEKLMNGAVADLVFTDPPYGVSYQSNMRKKSAKFDVLKNDESFISEWVNVLPVISNGWVFVWTSWKVIGKWIEITAPIGEMTNMIIWDKGGGGIGDLTGTFASDYEVALVFNRGAKITGKRLGSVWDIGKDKAIEYKHPTQKPVGLAQVAIENCIEPKGTVLDLFAGSGSTMIACQKTARRSFNMELDPRYCDVIISRYVKAVGNNKVTLNGKEIEWSNA